MNIVIIGGTGSLGNALVEHYYSNTNNITVLSRDEQKHFIMKEKFPNVRYLLADIRSITDLKRAFYDISCHYIIDVVIHAAALKHVSIGEYNPYQSVKTNIIGAQNVIDVCKYFSISKCVFISTDKAVEPLNLYGMCKSIAERLFIQNSLNSPSSFLIVRYGNVLNSNGSLLPLLHRNIETGKPLPLTDTNMTRFFITLDTAVSTIDFAINEDTLAKGSIVVPKLHSAKICDIVNLFAEKYNLSVVTIGKQHGEKIHEILLNSDEINRIVEYKDYYIVQHSSKKSNMSYTKINSYSSQDNLLSKDNVKNLLEINNLL